MFNPSVKLAHVFASYLSVRGGRLKRSDNFYEQVQISKVRFKALLAGEEQLTDKEAHQLAKFFSIKVSELI